jgi:hypothetical protein
MNEQEAREVLEKERRARVEQCKAEIQKLLEAHKCRIEVTVILRAGQVIPQIDILAQE